MAINNKAFFELLHEARRIRYLFCDKKQWELYLLGWLKCLKLHKDDLEIAENLKSFWSAKADGAE